MPPVVVSVGLRAKEREFVAFAIRFVEHDASDKKLSQREGLVFVDFHFPIYCAPELS